MLVSDKFILCFCFYFYCFVLFCSVGNVILKVISSISLKASGVLSRSCRTHFLLFFVSLEKLEIRIRNNAEHRAIHSTETGTLLEKSVGAHKIIIINMMGDFGYWLLWTWNDYDFNNQTNTNF